MSHFNETTTTDEVLEGIDLGGKRVVITGSSSGLGEQSARAMSSKGASVTMAARNPGKNEAAAARIRESVPAADLELRTLDLTNLGSVRAFAKDFLSDHDQIDILLNNAGVMVCPFGTTTDGFEMQIGTNHIGHFLLTGLLAPALVASPGARVVALSSGAHGISDIDYDDPMFERREYNPWEAYGQSKTANALFALELDRRLRDQGVNAFAVHPGVIMTELARHMTPEVMAQMNVRVRDDAASEEGESAAADEIPAMTFKPVEAGAATQVWAATAPELAEHGGAYLGDCQLGIEGGDMRGRGVESYARDPESAAKLWTVSEGWVGQSFDL
jgi:NAD(P)-dependent dehydrogenase (short-subunit alcohol dehydrogenase family)